MTEDRYLNETRKIVSRALAGHRVRVYLFGSRARGAPVTSSDCDIGIDPLEKLPNGLLSRIREQLEESSVPYAVELVDLSQTAPEFTEKVRQEGIVWIGSESG